MRERLQKYFQKKFKNKWLIIIPWILFPFILSGIYLLTIYEEPFIITNEAHQSLLKAFSDQMDGGNSESHILENHSGLRYSYKLGEVCDFPYAGVWYVAKKDTWFDLSGYDYFKIRSGVRSGNWITISLGSHIPGYSVDDVVNTHKYFNHLIPSGTDNGEVSIPIKDFSTPLWWYTLNKKKESDFKEVDLSRIKYIIFVHTPSNDSGIENIVEIQEAGFYIDWLPVFFKIIIGIVTYFTCAFLIYYYILRKPVNPSVNFTYQKIESVNHKDREEVIINNFLIENFYNPELSISDIRAATGLSERRISAIIKSKADVSFKQYLNQIRMAEAKKLLVETDLQISEIAFRTGYGSASHFNRVFKSTENCSPNDFRKMHAQKPASST